MHPLNLSLSPPTPPPLSNLAKHVDAVYEFVSFYQKLFGFTLVQIKQKTDRYIFVLFFCSTFHTNT